MVCRRKACIASSYDDNIGYVTATQRLIDLLIFKVGLFEPEIVDKIFVEVWRSEILAPIMNLGKILQSLLLFSIAE
jgi:hypothetical protein